MKPAIDRQALSRRSGRRRRGRRAPAAPCAAWCRRRAACRDISRQSPVRVLVDGVERIHQAIAEGIGVDIERRMDEMRDVGPVLAILVRRSSIAGPRLSRCTSSQISPMPLGRQLALAPLVVDAALELDEGDLAHHRVEHVLDLAGEHRSCAAAGRSRAASIARKVSISPKTEAVSARVSGVSAIRLPCGPAST